MEILADLVLRILVLSQPPVQQPVRAGIGVDVILRLLLPTFWPAQLISGIGAFMDIVLLSRWQFALTIIYHFFFVPLTLGLGWLVAILETHVRGEKERNVQEADQILWASSS